jgi:hypothetical protein
MSHEAHITGYQDIVIQRVTDGRSMLHVNGEAEEICDELVALRVLLMRLLISLAYINKM